MDPPAHAYFATLLSDVRFNSPLAWTFMDLVAQQLRRLRERASTGDAPNGPGGPDGSDGPDGPAAGQDSALLNSPEAEPADPPQRRLGLVRTRWFLMLTLANNPSLAPTRRRHGAKQSVSNFRLQLQLKLARRQLLSHVRLVPRVTSDAKSERGGGGGGGAGAGAGVSSGAGAPHFQVQAEATPTTSGPVNT